jgi:hypothetical protein
VIQNQYPLVQVELQVLRVEQVRVVLEVQERYQHLEL